MHRRWLKQNSNIRLHLGATIVIFTLAVHSNNTEIRKDGEKYAFWR